MAVPAAPQCLHIPELYAGERALLYWREVPDAAQYRLEACYDETFEEALIGPSWENLDTEERSWSAIAALSYTWQEGERLPARGLRWENFDAREMSWEQLEAQNLSWQQAALQPPDFTVYRGAGQAVPVEDAGLNWDELQAHSLSWSEMEGYSYTWQQFEKIGVLGPTWADMEAKFLTWEEGEAQNLSWQQLQTLVDDAPHRGCTVVVPTLLQGAYYRLRAISAQGEEGPYLLSSRQYLIAKETVLLQLTRDAPVMVSLDGRWVKTFEGAFFTVLYDAQQLAYAPRDSTFYEHFAYSGEAQLVSYAPGSITFRCRREIPSERMWSGVLAQIAFTARVGGTAQVTVLRRSTCDEKIV